MIKSYLKIAWRNILKNKTNSIINMVGLSAGLSCFTLIALWVSDELSYDKFNLNYHRIFRLVSIERAETGVEESAMSSAPMAKALKENYPEVENAVRLKIREEIIMHKNQQVLQPGILLTDPSFFEVFSFHLLRGDAATSLTEPYSIVLTESTAKKYFANEDPMGRTLTLNMYDTGYGASYTITGIMPDPPGNAHFSFTMLASFKTIEKARPAVLSAEGWGDASFYTYLLLKQDTDGKRLSKKIADFPQRVTGAEKKDGRSDMSYRLQPLADIYLRSNLQHELGHNGSITRVEIFSTTGILILLLAAINYTNLATARSVSRAKEVGIRKVSGAEKSGLITQYLSESVFTAISSLLFSLFTCYFLQSFFFQITGKKISIFSSPILLLFLLILTIFVGLLSGIYPAVILSAFKPAMVLKGVFKSGEKGLMLRNTLVLSQFVITMILLTGIIVIFSQLSYIKNKDLGFNKEELLYIPVHGNSDVIKGFTAFKNELETNVSISGITTSNSLIGGVLNTGAAETDDLKGKPISVSTARLRVDNEYFAVYGIQLCAGKNFKPGAARDSIQQVILNETAVAICGWPNPAAAIGKRFNVDNRQGTVIGVTKDFHHSSLQQTIGPLAIIPLDNHFSRITLKVDLKRTDQVVAAIERAWKKHFPSALFEYGFLDDQIQAHYIEEEKFSRIFLYFSVLSLVIACLGLYGLISYTLFQKKKEIGVRKVLGATASGIALKLSCSMLKPVLLAAIVAIPVAWMLMNQWLEHFAYRINLSWWMFTVATALVFSVALMTVGFQTLKSAFANPIKSLRAE
jgi:putative ABC transport system permease protein